eukprot:6914-Heterococcus_DN1.PRE.1
MPAVLQQQQQQLNAPHDCRPALAKAWRQCAGNKKAFLAHCARQIDKYLCVSVCHLKEQVDVRLDAMTARLQEVQSQYTDVYTAIGNRAIDERTAARHTADCERQEKALLRNWVRTLKCSSDTSEQVDGVELIQLRYALGTALAAGRYTGQQLVKADTHNVLTQMLAHRNSLVSGAAALAISEIARHEECRHALLQANAMPLLARVARECLASTGASCACNAMAILCSVSSATVSWSDVASQDMRRYSTGPTKPVSITAAVTVAAQYSYHPRVTIQLLLRALSVLVNSLYGNGESCRGVALEYGATAMLVSVLQQTDNEECLAMAARSVGNLSYDSPNAATALLHARCDTLLCELVRSSDASKHSYVSQAALVALANMCNNDINRAHLGGTQAIKLALNTCKYSTSATVVTAAADCLAAICLQAYDSTSLTKYDSAEMRDNDNSIVVAAGAVTALLQALAVILKHPTARLQAKGHATATIVSILLKAENVDIMVAAAAAVSALYDANTVLQCRQDEQIIEAEAYGCLRGLHRCIEWTYSSTGNASKQAMQQQQIPAWLQQAIDLLTFSVEKIESTPSLANTAGKEALTANTFWH